MANIRRRIKKDGTYSYTATVRIKGHPDISKTFSTEEAARVWSQNIKLSLKNESKIPKLKLNQFIERYEVDVVPSLDKKYYNSVSAHLTYWKNCLGNKIATEVDSLEIEHYANKLYKEGLSPETRRKYLVALSSVYNSACKFWKWALFNPVKSVDTHQLEIKKSQKIRLDRKLNIYNEYHSFKSEFRDAIENKIKTKNIVLSHMLDNLKISKSMYQNVIDPLKNCTIGLLFKVSKYLGIELSITEPLQDDSSRA